MAKNKSKLIRMTEQFEKRLKREAKKVNETSSEYVRKACEQRWEKGK